MDEAFIQRETCSEEHFAWEEKYRERLTSELSMVVTIMHS